MVSASCRLRSPRRRGSAGALPVGRVLASLVGLRWVSVFLGGVSLVACGGEAKDGAGSCEATSGCGGDVLGAWHITTACVDTSKFSSNLIANQPEACRGTIVDMQFPSVDLVMDLRADGTVVTTGQQQVSSSFEYTKACLQALNPAVTEPTAELCAAIEQSLYAGDEPPAQASCSLSESSCKCSARLDMDVNDTDTYVVNGTMITFGSGETDAFCVNGDTLTFSADPAGPAPVTAVAKRR